MADPARLFLDTNVLVSALVFGGVPEELLLRVQAGKAQGVVSLHVLAEFVEVLKRSKFDLGEETPVMLAEEIATYCEVFPLTTATRSWLVDQGDHAVVEAAIGAGVTALVSGDRHLLESHIPGLATLTPAEALALVGG